MVGLSIGVFYQLCWSEWFTCHRGRNSTLTCHSWKHTNVSSWKVDVSFSHHIGLLLAPGRRCRGGISSSPTRVHDVHISTNPCCKTSSYFNTTLLSTMAHRDIAACSLAARKSKKELGKKSFIKERVDPILEELSKEFWVNESSIRNENLEVGVSVFLGGFDFWIFGG